MKKLLSVGKILNFHGIKGEVKVGYTTGKEHQLEQFAQFIAEIGCKSQKLTLERVRFSKKLAVMKFKEFNSIDEAVEFKGAFLKVEQEELELENDEFFIDDLIGVNVYDDQDNLIGTVANIVNFGGNDLLVVKNNDEENAKESMVPFVSELVPFVNIKENKIVINNIPGLIKKYTDTDSEEQENKES